MDYVKIIGHKDPTVFTAEIILERKDGDSGEPTVVAQKGVPVQLSADNQKKLKDMGYELASSSKEEAEHVQQFGTDAASDTAQAGPVMGSTSSNPPPGETLGDTEGLKPTAEAQESKTDETKSTSSSTSGSKSK